MRALKGQMVFTEKDSGKLALFEGAAPSTCNFALFAAVAAVRGVVLRANCRFTSRAEILCWARAAWVAAVNQMRTGGPIV